MSLFSALAAAMEHSKDKMIRINSKNFLFNNIQPPKHYIMIFFKTNIKICRKITENQKRKDKTNKKKEWIDKLNWFNY